MKKSILVTGATGNVGMEVIKHLNKSDNKVIAGVRNIKRAEKCFNSETELTRFDFEDQSSFEVMKGINKLFLVRPPHISDAKRYIKPVIDAAVSYKVEHIVFLSLLGAEKNKFVPHNKIESYILSSGIKYTFLRAGFFMQNLNTAHLDEIRDKNVIYIPAGKGKTSFIDVRDIAEIAANVLESDTHFNKAYDITGSEALDYYEAAEIMTSILGRKINYVNPSSLEFILSKLRSGGMPLGQILVMAAIYFTTRVGLASKITGDAAGLLNRNPRRLNDYVRDYNSCWVANK